MNIQHIAYSEIVSLLPHEPPMVLVGSAQWSGGDELVTQTPRELMVPFMREGKLPGWALIEVAAQSSAVQSAVAAQKEEKVLEHGFLVGLSGWKSEELVFESDELQTEVVTETVLGPLVLVRARVVHNQECVAEGQLKFHVEYAAAQ